MDEKTKNEVVDEQRWLLAFAKSQDKLAALADEALEELKHGETKPVSKLEP